MGKKHSHYITVRVETKEPITEEESKIVLEGFIDAGKREACSLDWKPVETHLYSIDIIDNYTKPRRTG